jgi:hypothetical protein
MPQRHGLTPLMHKLQSEEQKLESLFARVGRWLNKPI